MFTFSLTFHTVKISTHIYHINMLISSFIRQSLVNLDSMIITIWFTDKIKFPDLQR